MKFKHINSASSGIKKQTNILTYIVFLILADLDKIKFKNPDRYKQFKKKKDILHLYQDLPGINDLIPCQMSGTVKLIL